MAAYDARTGISPSRRRLNGRKVLLHLMRPLRLVILIGICGIAGCAELSASKGGGQTSTSEARRADPADIAVPAEYRIDVVATGLNMPSGVDFDEQNRPIVVESGYSYGETF